MRNQHRTLAADHDIRAPLISHCFLPESTAKPVGSNAKSAAPEYHDLRRVSDAAFQVDLQRRLLPSDRRTRFSGGEVSADPRSFAGNWRRRARGFPRAQAGERSGHLAGSYSAVCGKIEDWNAESARGTAT